MYGIRLMSMLSSLVLKKFIIFYMSASGFLFLYAKVSERKIASTYKTFYYNEVVSFTLMCGCSSRNAKKEANDIE